LLVVVTVLVGKDVSLKPETFPDQKFSRGINDGTVGVVGGKQFSTGVPTQPVAFLGRFVKRFVEEPEWHIVFSFTSGGAN
jgi:hypothetical protein